MGKGKAWTDPEERILCQAWINLTASIRQENSKPTEKVFAARLWDEVRALVVGSSPKVALDNGNYHCREPKTIVGHFKRSLAPEARKFNKALKLVRSRRPFGVTEDQIRSMAIAVHLGKTSTMDHKFENLSHGTWKRYRIWLMLKDEPAFVSRKYSEKKQVTTTAHEGDDADYKPAFCAKGVDVLEKRDNVRRLPSAVSSKKKRTKVVNQAPKCRKKRKKDDDDDEYVPGGRKTTGGAARRPRTTAPVKKKKPKTKQATTKSVKKRKDDDSVASAFFDRKPPNKKPTARSPYLSPNAQSKADFHMALEGYKRLKDCDPVLAQSFKDCLESHAATLLRKLPDVAIDDEEQGAAISAAATAAPAPEVAVDEEEHTAATPVSPANSNDVEEDEADDRYKVDERWAVDI